MSELRDRVAKQYESFEWRESRANTYLSEDILTRIRLSAMTANLVAGSARIIDVGCGSGRVAASLMKDLSAALAVGVDVLPRFDARADIEFVLGDARHLPFASCTFDLSLLMTVLSSLPDSGSGDVVIEECLRVTKSGGSVLIYDFVVKNPLNRFTRPVSVGRLLAALRPMAVVKVERVTLNPLIARLVFASRVRSPELVCDYLAKAPLLRHHVLIRAVKN